MVSKLVSVCGKVSWGAWCSASRTGVSWQVGAGRGCRVEYLGLLRVCYEYILCVDMAFHVCWKGVCSPVVCRVAVSLFIPPAKCGRCPASSWHVAASAFISATRTAERSLAVVCISLETRHGEPFLCAYWIVESFSVKCLFRPLANLNNSIKLLG